MSDLFQPFQLGPITLANRVVMAPLTRSRAEAGNVPGPLTVEYYTQRATIGLIIAEATQVSATAQGYPNTPGLHTAEQVAGWRKVTDAVHAQGGKIFVQLWHVGRMSHTAYQPDGQAPVAPSAIAAKAKTFVPGQGMVDCSTPRALETAEIAGVVNDFRTAARNAIDAGFDGVEIHGAHGYLIDAFLRDGSNQRTDQYGGSIENRARFLLEVMTAVTAEIGADRVGIRLSPVSPVNDSSESNPQPLFEYVVRELEKLHPVFLHVVEGHTGGPRDNAPFDYDALRKLYSGVWMVNNGYST
ncbi:MAG: alkene reductase, partial [Aquabacterium sp.]|nr:alkene reductase [Aquabacterium sp.]